MLFLKDASISPGDILFLVSTEQDWFSRLKRGLQSITTPHGRHGHREVISTFVCTSTNRYGLTFRNHERDLRASTKKTHLFYQKQPIEVLMGFFQRFATELLCESNFRKVVAAAGFVYSNETSLDVIQDEVLSCLSEDKEKLILFLLACWKKSEAVGVLPAISASLLVFKFTDPVKRAQFLEAYNKTPIGSTSMWALFVSLFKSSKQDHTDRDGMKVSEKDTYCARQIMDVLNQVDPNLVQRGSFVTPKSLEAGLREALTRHSEHTGTTSTGDDLEDLIVNTAQQFPPFELMILPVAGTKLMNELFDVIDKQLARIEHKWWCTTQDRLKISGVKAALLPYRKNYAAYSITLQTRDALQILGSVLPLLKKKKSGWFEAWFPAKSYTTVRDFARRQGIFDGDVRVAVKEISTPQSMPLFSGGEGGPALIFSDWALSQWTPQERRQMIAYFRDKLAGGARLYVWSEEQLVQMNAANLDKAFDGSDFEDPLAQKVRPAQDEQLYQAAEKIGLKRASIEILNHQACQSQFMEPHSLSHYLEHAAVLFSDKMDPFYLKKAKLQLIAIELANTNGEEVLQRALIDLKASVESQVVLEPASYASGIDTQTVASSGRAKRIFQSISPRMQTPNPCYYRQEVHTSLMVNAHPKDMFDYFILGGRDLTTLQPCDYQSHPQGFGLALLRQRQGEARIVEGTKQLLIHNEWQALPSLHPQETLLDVAIAGWERERDFEIAYSPANHLYYIKGKRAETQPIEFKCMLQLPTHYHSTPLLSTLMRLPGHEGIHALLTRYLQYRKEDGSLRASIGPGCTGAAYLDKARRLGVGSCRLRAIAFKEEMTRLYPEVPVHVSVNARHCFIEMALDGQWQRYCLGPIPSLFEALPSMNTCCFWNKKWLKDEPIGILSQSPGKCHH